MSHTDTEIQDYLARYAASLTAFDAAAAAELWSMPAMIIDDRASGVLTAAEAMTHGLEQSYPVYRRLGLSSVSHECLEIEHLTDAITLVHVRWRFHDSDGNELTDSTAYYVLRSGADGLQACVCIQVDDGEKIHALAAERGVDLSPPLS